MFENIGLRFALIMLGTFNQGWLMNSNWKLKLIEVIPYLILAITLLVTVVYEKSNTEDLGHQNGDPVKRITLKFVENFEQVR